MLNERRVIQMTRMEIKRNREYDNIESFLNVDKKDYIAVSNVTGFIAGSVFYIALAVLCSAVVFAVMVDNLTKLGGIIFLLAAAIGYVAFIYFYRSWHYKNSLERYRQARSAISSMKKDLNVLEDIYRQEDEAAKPTVDMNLLFPEGSLGEEDE